MFMLRRHRIAFLISIIFILLLIWIFFQFFYNTKETELVLYGNVDVRQVDIGFRVNGKVYDLLYEEGDFVPKGSLMATLEKSPYASQVSEAEASLEAIQVNLKNAEALYKRREELIGVGGVSQEDLDNSRTNFFQLKANLAQAEANLAVSKDNLQYTEAFAPTDGIILTRIREPGTVVNVSDPVYTLSVVSPVWIRAFIDEPHLGDIFYGMEAEIFTDTAGERSYSGKIGFISPISEFTPKTVESTQLRTDLVYRLRIYVDNYDRYLKQGMPVTVKLKLNQKNG